MSSKTAKRHHQSQALGGGSRQAPPRPVTRTPAERPHPKPKPRRRRLFDPSWGQLVAVAVVLIAAAFFLLGGRGATGGAVKTTPAPDFSMASTSGGNVSLADFAGRNLLLYFNEGVGCDACFYQTVELQKQQAEFAAKKIDILPVVMNPVADVRSEMKRFGITMPYAIDSTGSVSEAYGVLGKGMHANLPGHGFVFIDAKGRIRWEKEYPSMYASAGEVLSAVTPFAS